MSGEVTPTATQKHSIRLRPTLRRGTWPGAVGRAAPEPGLGQQRVEPVLPGLAGVLENSMGCVDRHGGVGDRKLTQTGEGTGKASTTMRPPPLPLPTRSLLAGVLVTSCVVTAALGWSGLRLLTQQRELDERALRQRVDVAADRFAAAIHERLADEGDRLDGWITAPCRCDRRRQYRMGRARRARCCRRNCTLPGTALPAGRAFSPRHSRCLRTH